MKANYLFIAILFVVTHLSCPIIRADNPKKDKDKETSGVVAGDAPLSIIPVDETLSADNGGWYLVYVVDETKNILNVFYCFLDPFSFVPEYPGCQILIQPVFVSNNQTVINQ